MLLRESQEVEAAYWRRAEQSRTSASAMQREFPADTQIYALHHNWQVRCFIREHGRKNPCWSCHSTLHKYSNINMRTIALYNILSIPDIFHPLHMLIHLIR